jgi:hypothetical protein
MSNPHDAIADDVVVRPEHDDELFPVEGRDDLPALLRRLEARGYQPTGTMAQRLDRRLRDVLASAATDPNAARILAALDHGGDVVLWTDIVAGPRVSITDFLKDGGASVWSVRSDLVGVVWAEGGFQYWPDPILDDDIDSRSISLGVDEWCLR